MAAVPRIRSIEFLSPKPENPDSGGAKIRVSLEDGSSSAFSVLTPSHVGLLMNEAGKDFSFGHPALFVRRLDAANVAGAVEAMAARMSGFWLRYYNSKPSGGKAKKPRVAAMAVTEAEPAASPGHCSAVVQVSLADGRQFSILAATPAWFADAFAQRGLEFYFGPGILFVRTMDLGLVHRAVAEMAKHGDQWLCRYDTPRTTLDKVLSEFRAQAGPVGS